MIRPSLAALAAGLLIASGACADQEKRMSDGASQSIAKFIEEQSIDTSQSGWKQSLPKPPLAKFDASKTYWWDLETSEGPIQIKLDPKTAPMHVTSTIYLTQLGFYDGTPFHRVIEGFMAQGGDPTGSGRGGPGYTYDGEFDPSVKHDRKGMLSMANAGPGTDGSQFFLTFVPTPWLDGKHTIFGTIEGDESIATLDKLEAAGSPGAGTPKKPLSIVKAQIRVE